MIKEHCRTGDGRPFFLNLWHYAVHTPIQAKQEDVVRFEEKAQRLGLNREKATKEEGFHHTKEALFTLSFSPAFSCAFPHA